jgi:WXXGXW repeat (2 copies)
MRKISVFALFSLAILMLALPSASPAQVSVGVAIHIGPPALPVYAQPICPGPGYLWTPGYWAYGPAGYYWVPGTWVVAPAVGLLWTPGYWGWGGGGYFWHAGYWGPHVGFYGGINYGFGYGGVGFIGGRWNGGVFAYNTAVMHVDTTVVHTTYVDRTVVNNVTVNHVSYNGGTGGITARPTSAELAVEHEHHIAPTTMQTQHEHTASTNRALLASENHGRPEIAATARPGEFTGHGVVSASHGNTVNGGIRPPNTAEMHKTDRPPSANSGNNPSNTSHANTTQVNNHPNNAGNAAKNQSHPENKPPKENKPHEGGEKPHK